MLTTTKHKAAKDVTPSRLAFQYYPAFARFIRENHMREYVKDLLAASREANLPLMKHIGHIPEEQLIEMGMQGHGEFLQSVENKTLEEHVRKSLAAWENDEIGILGQDEIGTEDITLGSYVRKKVQLEYLQLYTANLKEALAIVREIDIYESESSTAAINTYIRILRKKIHEHAHFIESVANTTPSIIYVYDRVNKRELYANSKMAELLGCTLQELQSQGADAIQHLIHPDDIERLIENERKFDDTADSEIRTVEYRVKDASGHYRWMRAYESVFKRNKEGHITEKIGVAIDIDSQKDVEEQLQQRERQLLEAQELVNMGSYVLDIDSGELDVTPQYLAIFEIKGRPDREELMKGIHPGDRARLAEAREKAIRENGIYEAEYRHMVNGREKIIWARSNVTTRDGRKIMQGTVIDVTDRHYMIQRLQRSENLYKQAQAMSHIGNWVWDLLQGRLEWSDELYHIYGLEPGTPVDYETIFAYNHPDDVDKVQESIRTSMETLEPHSFTYRIINAQGKMVTVEAKGEVLADETGKPFKLLGTLQDITERQSLINQLQESEKLYKEAQALAHLGNFTHDLKTNEITWTDEVYRIYGLEPQSEKINFEKVISFVHPDSREYALKQWYDTIESLKPYDCKYKVLLRDGTVKVVHRMAEVVYDNDGKPASINGTVQDITREYLAEQEIIANREFIEKIANTTPSLIAAYNIHTGKYAFINSAIEKILGYPQQRVLDGGLAFFMEIIHPDDVAPIMEKNTKAIEEANQNIPPDGKEPIVEFKYRLKHKDGHYHWFHTYGTIFERNEKGHVEQVLNVSVDITDQEEAEQELQQKNLQLQQSNASLEEYAYVASHDLKEPLRKIATFGDRLMMTQKERLSEEGKVHLEKIISSSRRMQSMISDLLAVSMISGDKTFETYSLQAILGDVMQTLEYKIEEKNAVITTDGLPMATIVPSQFRQLFQNLISNSLKFTREEVTPQISISHTYLQPQDVQQYKLAPAKKYLQIRFADNGIGFDNQFANKIFTIFQRLHGRAEYEGTGIGLAICRKVAENHGGTVVAEGTPGKGAVFTIIVPA